VYETPNKGTILKPRNLWTKERPIRHRVFFNHSWREKRGRQGVQKDALVTKNDIQWGGSNLMYTQEKGL
jgi:hypothetical protein